MKVRRLVVEIGVSALWLVGLVLIGCEGEQGPSGPSGVNPQMPPVITAVVAMPDSVGTGQTTTLLVSAYDPNGDEMTYVWLAGEGALSSTNTAATVWTAPTTIGLRTIFVTVSDAGGSAHDSIMVGVNVYVPSVFPSYLGDNANSCGHCHSHLTEKWHGTGHSHAYQTLVDDGVENNRYCLQCHTTGFDDEYDHDGNLVTAGANTGGYDDNPVETLRNVQCEACHGAMGPNPATHQPQQTGARTGETCGQCHPAWAEYITSAHGTTIEREGGQGAFWDEWGRSSCWGCHTSEGFIAVFDPDYAGQTPPETSWQVTCATCHDPHESNNEYQLRTLTDVVTPYGGEDEPSGHTITGWGNGQICAKCHHARPNRDAIMAQIANGNSRPGPHRSPQADMVSGRGSYEIPGFTYEREAQHSTSLLTNMCVDCHVVTREFGDPDGPAYGHTFAPQLSKCQACHSGAANFDIDGAQTEIEGLIEDLAALLPHDTAGNVRSTMDTLNWTYAQREAGYAYYFVSADASHGIHNFDYAKSLLENAIDYLSTAAVVDKPIRPRG